MKKSIVLFLFLMFSPLSHAEYAKGVVEEFMVCGVNNSGTKAWKRVLQFKVQGKWFGSYADFYGDTRDLDNNITTSLIFMAYSQKKVIEINATSPWDKVHKSCGNERGFAFHGRVGDYIRMKN